ncbi:hypothetical protein AURDEDRAFT_168932 [Auricularia subglabra TFB-10046 SS5]|nr:hypothetical protein AURDEDRAFT_168932 [Auricularia subglabra TFB-10046 SS5]
MSGPSVARDGVRGRPSPAAPEATGNGSDNGLALPRTAGLVTVPQKIGCGNSAVYAAHVRVQDPAWSPANMKRIEHSFLPVTADHLWRCDLAASEPNILAPSSREFTHDETNRAWWIGTPSATVELSLWSADFLIGRFLLFLLTLPILVPHADRIHPTMLFWVPPSKQIRPQLCSLKHKR